MRIEEAINQKKFVSEMIKLDVNISYTASWSNARKNKVLKQLDISWQQFNILRILRGMKPQAASVRLLTDRMIDKMSNTSRLVDKLEAKGLVERKACPTDRRRVDISITAAGLDLVNEASERIENLIDANMNLTEKEARQLNELLDKLRS